MSKEIIEGEQKPILVGDQEFASMEELTSAYSSLKKTVGRQGKELGELKKRSSQGSPDPGNGRGSEVDVDEAVLTEFENSYLDDPKKAARTLITKAIKPMIESAVRKTRDELNTEFSSRGEKEKRWDGFFRKNPALKAFESEVKSAARGIIETLDEGASLVDEENAIVGHFRPKIEAAARAMFGEKLPKGTIPADIGGAPVAKGQKREQTEEVSTMYDEIREQSLNPMVSKRK